MSRFKIFLNKRSEGVAKENAKKNGTEYEKKIPKKTETVYEINKDKGIIEYEKEVEELEDNPNLTDDEFWDISNKLNKEIKNSGKDAVEILQEIFKEYTPLKIRQFGKRYSELNS